MRLTLMQADYQAEFISIGYKQEVLLKQKK